MNVNDDNYLGSLSVDGLPALKCIRRKNCFNFCFCFLNALFPYFLDNNVSYQVCGNFVTNIGNPTPDYTAATLELLQVNFGLLKVWFYNKICFVRLLMINRRNWCANRSQRKMKSLRMKLHFWYFVCLIHLFLYCCSRIDATLAESDVIVGPKITCNAGS